MKTSKQPEPDAIRAQLARILRSADFRASEKQRNFLRFIMDEFLDGRAPLIKGYTIAVNVYGRNQDFDPAVDPIVRVEAGRLRRALERYYLTAGKQDLVRIDIPKGGYAPRFGVVATSRVGAEPANPPPEKIAPLPGTTIAVLPFADLTGGEDREFFTDGLTEEITSELARYQDFRVIASQSSLRFKGSQADPGEIGRELQVRFLLTGSVRSDADNIKIMVQLLDTTSAEQIWGGDYKRELTAADLIGIQENIARAVVGVIADQWGLIERRLSREAARKAPADLSAYEAVLRFYHYETVLTAAAFADALAALERATELDPDYGLAWSMLGHLHADNHALGLLEIPEPLVKALSYAKKGVALAPDSQFAWDALALVHFHLGDKQQLLETVEKTIALNPNSPYIVGVAGWHLSLYGEWERGRELMAKGMELNPYHPSWFHLVPFLDHFRQGEFAAAYAEALKFNLPGLFWDPVMRAAALVRLGRSSEARIAIGQLLELVPDFAARGGALIGGYVKVPDLVEALVDALRDAGLTAVE